MTFGMRLTNEQAPDDTNSETDSTSASSSIWVQPDGRHLSSSERVRSPSASVEGEQPTDSHTTDRQHPVDHVYEGMPAAL